MAYGLRRFGRFARLGVALALVSIAGIAAADNTVLGSDTIPPGTADIRLRVGRHDPSPPAGITISLVGYSSTDRVSVVTAKTDATGVARFTGLDQGGGVAYFALARLSRKAGSDRLMSWFVLDHERGLSVTLESEPPTSTAPSLDQLVALAPPASVVATAAGQVRVSLVGLAGASTPVEVIDAATGKVVGKAVAAGAEVIAAMPRSGMFYVEAVAHGQRYRSPPFESLSDRGTQLSVYLFPRVLARYQLHATAYDDLIEVTAEIRISNSAWSPYAKDAKGITLPLPHGARHAVLSADGDPGATLDHDGLVRTRPLPPGPTTNQISFDLPATGGAIDWVLDLPLGMYDSRFTIDDVPGVDLEPPFATNVEPATDANGASELAIANIAISPDHPMAMKIHVPKPPRDAALVHACRALHPDRANRLLGAQLPAIVLSQLDGKQLELSSLRGQAVLVNLMASWNGLSRREVPELAKLAGRVAGLAIVIVASDADPKEVAPLVGKRPPFHVVLDPPPQPDANIGAVTTSLGVSRLPETFLIDRSGVVRFHIVGDREWNTAESLACLKAVAAIR